MKSKMTSYIVTLFLCICYLSGNAQTTIPKGKAQLIEFTNATAKFTVPLGKTWFINSVFSNHDIDLGIKVYIKSINSTILTDLTKKEYGTLLYNSRVMDNTRQLIFPENTNFELIILSGDWDVQTICNKKSFLNYVETDN